MSISTSIWKQARETNWTSVFSFYLLLLLATYGARKLPNLLSLLLAQLTDIPFSFNYNHGLVTLLLALVFYRLVIRKPQLSLFGQHKLKSLLFPIILLGTYGVVGIGNDFGLDRHVWALLFCTFALIYNLMEEFAWRGFLIESLSEFNMVLKCVISGLFWACWHLLVFANFDQYGGFWMFCLFCVLFSFLLTFAVLRTHSILAAASIHTFLVQMNLATGICLGLFLLLLVFWNGWKGRSPASLAS